MENVYSVFVLGSLRFYSPEYFGAFHDNSDILRGFCKQNLGFFCMHEKSCLWWVLPWNLYLWHVGNEVSISSGISRLARCRFLQPGLQWPVGSITLVCWTTGMWQPSNQLTTQMLQMPLAGGGMQSNPSITPWWFNHLPAKCYLCVLWYYPNTVIAVVCHFKIKCNLPGLENIILLSAVCSPLIDTADPCMQGVSLRLPLLHFNKTGFVL